MRLYAVAVLAMTCSSGSVATTPAHRGGREPPAGQFPDIGDAASRARPISADAADSAIPALPVTDRVVSLNLCTDQMLVLLAPRKIAGLSTLSRDPALSFVAADAVALPVVRGAAEAVLALHPDLVLAARYGAQTTLALLERLGIRVVRIDLPTDFAGIRTMVRTVGTLLDATGKADTLISAMDRTLAEVTSSGPPRTALAMAPRGYMAGPGSLMDAVLRAAALTNVSDGRRMSIEALLRHPPDLLVIATAPGFPSLATAMLETNAIAAIPRRAIPSNRTICAGPFTADAVAMLAR